MFRGEFHNHVDEKGRVSIPARFREQLENNEGAPLILTQGLDTCLFLYPSDIWRRNEEQLARLNPLDAGVRQFVRAFMKGSEECVPDKQGRIVIPPHLREAAGIRKSVVVVGVLNRIEIWDKQRWEDYHAQSAKSLEMLAQQLSEQNKIEGLTL